MRLGKYELHEIIGKGGFGTVYRAIDLTLQRPVAVKVLHASLIFDDSQAVQRFYQEAQVPAQLDHPNVVTIYDVGEVDGRYYIAMRYIPGGNLATRLKEGPLTLAESILILTDVCAGLQVAHDHGWVHRDIKPANILFDANGHAVLSDFGLVRAVQNSTSTISSQGTMRGTPVYMAPELWRGKPPASPATDVYALGCTLGEMLTGCPLFSGETPDVILTKHLLDGPDFGEGWPPPGMEAIAQVINKAIHRDPTLRYQNASEFLSAVLAIGGSSIPATVPERKPHPHPNPGKPAEARKNKGLLALLLTSIVLLVLGLSIMLYWLGKEPANQPVYSSTTSTLTPTATYITGTATHTQPQPRLAELGVTRVRLQDGMVEGFIPAGEFSMGTHPVESLGTGSDIAPVHLVYLDSFWIDRMEVTNAMYQRCVKDGACSLPSHSTAEQEAYFQNQQYSNYPVVSVTWKQASDYCQWVDGRLPTEAEWEKAARGSDNRLYPWGNADPHSGLLNHGYSVGRTSPVGSYLEGASPYGILDMAGNVWEWVADWYSPDYYASQQEWFNPGGPESGEQRVLRGGSWM
ncbi:MAG TPA: bifunctional serine/threonine-protein kinase/formylglycine-generating enzyme family protein, partial [Anaerolineaceae bacterium]|nr:bifunctional serine/threonine-protein kinase/formylglycine-generating enzyme family protein [Anaerolineaceae bacterium]